MVIALRGRLPPPKTNCNFLLCISGGRGIVSETMNKIAIARALTAVVPMRPLRHIYRLYATAVSMAKYGDALFPRILTMEVNTHCNRHCFYCPNDWAPSQPKFMEDATLKAIVGRMAEINWSGITDFIFFSEPLMHPFLEDIVAFVHAAVPGSLLRISTNGDLLTHSRVEKLVKAGLSRIYAMRHIPHKDGWDENVASIARAFPGLVQARHIEELEANDGLEDFGGMVKNVKKLRVQQKKNGKPVCRVHNHIMQIGINGDWLLCCVDWRRSMSFGNLKEKSIMEIWKDEKFVRVRNLLRNGTPVCKACQGCACLRPQ